MILAIMNAHERPDLLFAQIENYNTCFNGEIIHGININAAYRDIFWREADEKSIKLKELKNVFFLNQEVNTGYGLIVHAYLRIIQQALVDNLKFEYIYFHTPADLLIKRDVIGYIRQFDAGCAPAYKYRFDARHRFVDHEKTDMWAPAMSKNPSLFRLAKTLGHDVVYRVRTEGAFFRTDLFFEMVFPWLVETSASEIEKLQYYYPQEETELVHCFELSKKRHDVKVCRNLIKTAENRPKQIVEIEDIESACAENDVFGVKRFPSDLNCEQRRYVAQLTSRAAKHHAVG